MKKLSFLFCLLCLLNSLKADIAPAQRAVPYCVKIQNADSFPEVTFVLIAKPSFNSNTFLVKSSDCVNRIVKCNEIEIFAINKLYLEKQGGISHVDFDIDEHALLTNINLPAIDFQFVMFNDPYKEIYEYYRILGFTDTSTIIYLSKQVTVYNDDHKDSSVFPVPADYSNLKKTIYSGYGFTEKSSQLLLYPSPSQEYLNFYLINDIMGNVDVEIVDLTGRKLAVASYYKTQVELKKIIDIKNLRSGIYSLRYAVGNSIENRLFLKK